MEVARRCLDLDKLDDVRGGFCGCKLLVVILGLVEVNFVERDVTGVDYSAKL